MVDDNQVPKYSRPIQRRGPSLGSLVTDHVVVEFDFEGSDDLRTRHFEALDELTEHGPFFYSTTPGFWMFTNMELIEAALRNTDLFSNEQMSAMKRDREKRVPYKFVPEQLDPPEHGKYRKVIMPMLSPAAMKAREPRIREIATELLQPLIAKGSCDVADEFARPLVRSVFLEIFGLEGAEAMSFAKLASNLVVGDPTDIDGSKVQKVFEDITAFLAAHIEDRRSNPRDDLLSGIVQATVDGEPISESKLSEMAILLFVGGLETTIASLAYLIRHCAGDLQTQELIRSDRSLVPNAVEESLRMYSQISPSRKAVADADFHGCPIKSGDYLVLPLSLADRDPDAFEDPLHFDVHRRPNRHIAFGVGPHRCAGAHLARVELYAAVDVFHQLIPTYRHAPNASFDDYVVGVSGPSRVDIVWSTDVSTPASKG